MLIIALVLALIGLVALVFAVVTSNELVAWVCIGASVLGVILLIVDAVRERQQREAGNQDDQDHKDLKDEDEDDGEPLDAVDYPEDADAGLESAAEPAEESVADESSKK